MDLRGRVPGYVAEILGRLEAAGHRAYAVGGCVRDLLMGREPHDWDIATSAGDGRIQELFERTVPTGLRYGTVTVLTGGGRCEVTTFRLDGEYLDGRKPETVTFVDDVERDLARRDLTVNAMALDLRGRIVDPFGGRRDIADRVLRCVGDPERRFREDALRMLRAVRFSAQLGFTVEAGTLAAIRELAPLAARLSAERVREEITKTLATDEPRAVYDMVRLGLLDRYLDRERALDGCDTEGGLLTAVPPEERLTLWAVLLARRGAAEGPDGLLRALRCTARQIQTAGRAGELASELSRGGELRELLRREAPEAVTAAASALGRRREALAGLEDHGYVTVRELRVTGGDMAALGLKGREIGRMLDRLSAEATAGRVENRREELLEAAKAIMAGGR